MNGCLATERGSQRELLVRLLLNVLSRTVTCQKRGLWDSCQMFFFFFSGERMCKTGLRAQCK